MSPGKVVRDTNSFGERFQKLFDDPTSYPGNAQDRKAFRRWAGDRFEEWYRRGHALITATGDQHKIEMFEDDWHPDGVMAAAAERRMYAIADALNQMRTATIREVIGEVRELPGADQHAIDELERRLLDGRG
jgi:hypothetical protein